MKDYRIHETVYSKKLAESIEGAIFHADCPLGQIDVLTPDEVIEVKHLKDWKAALGQALSYGACYPERAKRIHLLLDPDGYNADTLLKAQKTCRDIGVRVTTQKEAQHKVRLFTIGDYTFRSSKEVKYMVDNIYNKYKRRDD